ncbi:MAG: pilus assembly protein [Bacillota bacterium]
MNRKSERGAVVTEFCIISVILLFILLAGLSLQLLGWAKIGTIDAARDGARHEALGLGPASGKVEETIQDMSLKPENIKDTEVSGGGNYVTVTVKYDQPSIAPFLPLLFGQSRWDTNFHLESSSLFKKENQ